MKVYHIINGEHYSGAERVQDNICMEMFKFGVDAEIISLKSGIFTERRESDVILHSFEMKGKIDFKCMESIYTEISNGNPELLHTHTPRSLLVGVFCKIKSPKIRIFHHGHSPTLFDSERKFNNLINSLIENTCLLFAEKILCVSKAVESYFKNIPFLKNKTILIENGISSSSRISIPREINKGDINICTSALFRPRKGVDVLIRAMKKVLDSYPNSYLHLIGEFESEEYKTEVILLARSLGVLDKVKFHGFVSNPRDLILEFDIFVFPSMYGEGIPMALLEAMSIGIPCIGSDVNGVRDVIQKCGGELFESGSEDSLSEKICGLAYNLDRRKDLNEKSPISQKLNYSTESMARKVFESYGKR